MTRSSRSFDAYRRQLVKGLAATPLAAALPVTHAGAVNGAPVAWSGPIGQAAASLGPDDWTEVATEGLFDALTCANDFNQLSVAEFMDGMYAVPGEASLVTVGGGRRVWDEGTRYVRYDDATGSWSAVDYGGRIRGHTFAGSGISGRRLYVVLRDDLGPEGRPIPRVFAWDLRLPLSYYGDGEGFVRMPAQASWSGEEDWSGYPNAAINPNDPGAIYVWQLSAGGLKRIDLRTGTEQILASDFPDCTMGAFEGLMTYIPAMGEILIGGGKPRSFDSVQMWAVSATGGYRRLPDVPIQRVSRTALLDANGDAIFAPQFGCRGNLTADNLIYHPRTGMPLLWCRLDQRMLTFDGERWLEIGDPVRMPADFRDDGVEYVSDGDFWQTRGQTSLLAAIPALGVVAVVTTVNFEARLWLWRPPVSV
jgi:hypothetical protein